MNINFSPTFWAAVSFLIFILFAWSFIRKAFLKVISKYRNSISSSLNDLYNYKDCASDLLENSIKKLGESHGNSAVLNAHKMAKNLLLVSQERVDSIKKSLESKADTATHIIEDLLASQVKDSTIDSISYVVKTYCLQNGKKFNQTIANNLKGALK